MMEAYIYTAIGGSAMRDGEERRSKEEKEREREGAQCVLIHPSHRSHL